MAQKTRERVVQIINKTLIPTLNVKAMSEQHSPRPLSRENERENQRASGEIIENFISSIESLGRPHRALTVTFISILILSKCHCGDFHFQLCAGDFFCPAFALCVSWHVALAVSDEGVETGRERGTEISRKKFQIARRKVK
jgi:hypothetical protein